MNNQNKNLKEDINFMLYALIKYQSVGTGKGFTL